MHPGGLYGVELWANFNVPYGRLGHRELFFKRADFQVLHKDPRTLLVRVETEFVHFALLVGYAPQSGLPIAERCAWWDALQHIASLKAQDEQLFVFLRHANADPGPCDDKHVLTTGFKQTANTEFLRTFLCAHDLCLPMTSSYHQGSVDTWTSPSGQYKQTALIMFAFRVRALPAAPFLASCMILTLAMDALIILLLACNWNGKNGSIIALQFKRVNQRPFVAPL